MLFMQSDLSVIFLCAFSWLVCFRYFTPYPYPCFRIFLGSPYYLDMASPFLPSAIRALYRIGFQAVLPSDGYIARSLFHVADLYDRLVGQNIVDGLKYQRQKVCLSLYSFVYIFLFCSFPLF